MTDSKSLARGDGSSATPQDGLREPPATAPNTHADTPIGYCREHGKVAAVETRDGLKCPLCKTYVAGDPERAENNQMLAALRAQYPGIPKDALDLVLAARIQSKLKIARPESPGFARLLANLTAVEDRLKRYASQAASADDLSTLDIDARIRLIEELLAEANAEKAAQHQQLPAVMHPQSPTRPSTDDALSQVTHTQQVCAYCKRTLAECEAQRINQPAVHAALHYDAPEQVEARRRADEARDRAATAEMFHQIARER